MELFRISDDHPRNFAAQVNAINAGVAQMADVEYEFVGNLDADITVSPEYFEHLLYKFQSDLQLGLAGGYVYDKGKDGQFRTRRGNRVRSVPHAVQLFRRECFESIGAYVPLPYGGPDSHAETTARMKGWHVEAFPDLIVFHHRPTGSAGGILRGLFRQGKMDYSLGYLPLFEIIKLVPRICSKPYFIGAMTRLAGFVDSYCRKGKRSVSPEFIAFLRGEQRDRLGELFAKPLFRDLKGTKRL